MIDKRGRGLTSWLPVLLWSLFIFLTIPFARRIQLFVYNHLKKEYFTYAVLFIILVALVALLYIFIFRFNIRRHTSYIWLMVCAGLYGYFTVSLKEHPEETFHFIEYGILSYLFFRALSKTVHDHSVYITSIFFVFLVGIIDEFIQWMIPNRFWDIKDVGLNTLSGVIFMFGLWKTGITSCINRGMRRPSINILVTIITIDLLFLGFCLSNTPRFVSYYTERLSFLSWLDNEEPMVEYGYRYKDDDVGIIYSRLSMKQLKEIDTSRGEEYGKEISDILNRYGTFEELMRIYRPSKNPFLYEFMIHLQRREERLKDLRESRNPYMTRGYVHTILKEELILERYFTNTLRHSGYAMPEEIQDELRQRIQDEDIPYISNVGKLITGFDLKGLWLMLIATIVVVWIAAASCMRLISV